MVALGAACGQKGDLYLPRGEAAAGRSTLPQILSPAASPASSGSNPVTPTGAANPVPRP